MHAVQVFKTKLDRSWYFNSLTTKDTKYLTHGYHRYPAKFIPQIVQKLISAYTSPSDLICDPFGGCGTTLVEAKMLGRNSIGFDINPVAKLITETKITPIPPKKLNKYLQTFLNNYDNNCKGLVHSERIHYWFDQKNLRILDQIYHNIRKIDDSKMRRFFLCAFSHNLKNSSRWLMKSTKPTIDKHKKITNPKLSFLLHLNYMIVKNSEFYNKLRYTNNQKVYTKMYRRDSTEELPCNVSSVDLIITSPPYVTSYEYAELHQLSLLWFGEDKELFRWHESSRNMSSFKKKFIGTSYKNTDNANFNSIAATRIFDQLLRVDKGLARNVASYFIDMKKSFKEMYRILKPNGKACIIIGDTTLRGVSIYNSQVVFEQMKSFGFKKVKIIKRRISNKIIAPLRDLESGKFTNINNPNKIRIYVYEYIIIMKK